MNMYIHELKKYRKSTITWTISLVAMLMLFMSMFTTFAQDAVQYKRILDSFPEAFIKAIGMSTADFSTILGFYSFIFVYVLLIGAIQGMNLGASSLSAEMREKTADFLVAKPVKRSKIVTSKLLAVLTSLVITNAIFIVAAKITVDIFKKASYDFKTFLLITVSLFIVQLLFLTLGLFVSVLIRKLKTVLPLSLGTVFGFYIIHMLNETLDDVKLSYISPFSYFVPSKIIEKGSYDTVYLILAIVLIAIFTVMTYVVYQKKDIPSI